MAEAASRSALLASLERDAVHVEELRKALADLLRRCRREGVEFAVIGALAMRQHGYARFTEDIDIVTTPEGLATIHERLVGRGLVPQGPGLRKKLRDAARNVRIDILVSGEHAGAPGSPVVYPSPLADAFVPSPDGVRYATLDALLAFKISSGIWGRRPRDLADAQELIKINGLAEADAERLPEELRPRFLELLAGSKLERDIE
jgi:Nucleotidyl transferase AbiEii toxin, Type IV TA system